MPPAHLVTAHVSPPRSTKMRRLLDWRPCLDALENPRALGEFAHGVPTTSNPVPAAASLIWHIPAISEPTLGRMSSWRELRQLPRGEAAGTPREDQPSGPARILHRLPGDG